MMQFFKGVLFLIKFCWILFVEKVKYIFSIHQDYESFIVGITNKLIQFNILYVKIFQAFALNNDIIDDKINNTLIKFVDNAPWTNKEIDYNIIEILENEHDIEFDKPIMPFSSGMISLVFKGKRCATNEPIVVKMKRLNIEEKLNIGIDDLLVFLKFLMFIPGANKLQIMDVVYNNMDLVKHQINFIQEVKNIQIFNKICKHIKYVKIPNVDQSITEKYNNVILMDYISGVSVNKVDQDDYIDYARTLMKFVFVTTFLHGKIHGDLHSGNILFIKDDNCIDTKYKYKLGILDFGIIYEINSDTKSGMYDIITNINELTSDELAEIILNSSLIEPVEQIKTLEKEKYNTIISIISKFVNKTIKVTDNLNQFDVYVFLNELNEYINSINQNQNHIKFSPSSDFIKIQVLFGMVHGVVLKLCDGKYVQLSNEVIKELFSK
jgi:predicted unusual protein kinase regulating ubiquinone biosynthesis (AarF/ABC1/UbiB family)